MSKQCVLLDLPVAVFAQVLGTFVATTKEIGKLDSACCSHADRHKVLELLSHDELTFTLDSRIIRNTHGCMQWSLIRNVKFNTARLTERAQASTPVKLMVQFFQANQQHLVHVYETENVFGNQGIAKVMQPASGVYTRLKTLHLHGTKSVDATCSATVLQMVPNLEQLALHCHANAASYFAGAYCPKVTSVKLTGALTPESNRGFSTCFPNIGTLDILAFPMPPDIVPSLVTSCTKLYWLSLGRPSDVQDNHIRLIAEQCNNNLTHISLDYCSQLTIDSIQAICTHCTKLEFLSLDGHSGLPSAALTVIANNVHSTLKHLHMQNSFVGGRLDISVLRACTLLESLDIRQMEGLSSDDITVVCQSCPLLRILRMSFEHLSDTLLCALATHCVHMKCLSLAGSWGFSRIHVWAIAARLKIPLPTEDVSGDKFREQAIVLLRDRYPQLNIENCP